MEHTETRKTRIPLLLACIAIPVMTGIVSSLICGDAMRMFDTLDQPALSPPAWLFPAAWTILYVLMGIASYLIVISDDPGKTHVLALYAIQLFFNFCWSPLFFLAQQYWLALGWLVVMWALVALLILRARKINPASAALLVPYILWCTFATYLNAGIAILN